MSKEILKLINISYSKGPFGNLQEDRQIRCKIIMNQYSLILFRGSKRDIFKVHVNF